METKIQLSKMLKLETKIILLFILLIFENYVTMAQWNTIGNVGRTNFFPVFISKIGIGNFPNPPSIQAKLHINPFLLANDPATTGLLLRTDGNSTTNNMWQIFTGPNNNALTEKFRLLIPANTNDAILRVVQPNGNLLVQTTQRDSTNKTVITCTSDQTIIHNQLILKASDSEEYFLLTINSKGEIKTEKINFSGR